MLVQSLPEGPLDIVGDIHGEYGALLSLMDRMGYDYDGHHSEGRIMVFVGDLIDRGPDSISVVRLVRKLVEANRAYCVLGNHELNVLLGKANSGSKWLYGKKESLIRDKKDRHTLQALADEDTRAEILSFLRQLPIVLERSDVRVVHAAWDDAAVDKLRFDILVPLSVPCRGWKPLGLKKKHKHPTL
uniref:Calcineurin-like phosphoesterase domain-containing protein n=1 Tax=Rhodosorus marinus TaxID=101924 RepID=A0A7S0BV47_9RHOD|mmetsp:Transcript_9156/g.13381  ORF Transcript_9156/g.13381 Transcript_9156/m.13381 type:complete len:187 (+) Transcript_9156:174-734(+)